MPDKTIKLARGLLQYRASSSSVNEIDHRDALCRSGGSDTVASRNGGIPGSAKSNLGFLLFSPTELLYNVREDQSAPLFIWLAEIESYVNFNRVADCVAVLVEYVK